MDNVTMFATCLDQLETCVHQMRQIVYQMNMCSDQKLKTQCAQEFQQVWKDSLEKRQMLRLEIHTISPNHPLLERKRQLYAALKQVKNDFEYASPTVVPNLETVDGLVNYGQSLQAQSVGSLQKTVSTVHDARDQGIKINVKLTQQTEQIQGHGRRLDDLNQQVLSGSEVGRRMLRQWCHSKTIWVLIGLIVLGLVLIIVFKTQ